MTPAEVARLDQSAAVVRDAMAAIRAAFERVAEAIRHFCRTVLPILQEMVDAEAEAIGDDMEILLCAEMIVAAEAHRQPGDGASPVST